MARDLRQLADGEGLQAFLLSGQQADLAHAVHRAWFFSQQNADYDEVRYLDESGQELYRVNVGGAVVPREKLQNRANQPYFQKALALGAGQFYLSAFDLNVENGQVEQPLKPTVRIATPVFDARGNKRGVLVINCLVSKIIADLQDFAPHYRERLRMLNAQGYWIKSDRADQEWGFMFPEKAGRTLAQTDPALWDQVARNPQGQMWHAGGFFSWSRIVPRTAISAQPDNREDDPFLVIASEITPAEWTAQFTGLRETFSMVGVVLLLLVALLGWFLRARRRAQEERDRFFNLSGDLLCVAGFNGYFKRVNPAWSAALGYSTEELLARPFIQVVHPDDLEQTLAALAGLKQGREVLNFENRYRCKDGSYRWLSWSARSLPGEQLIFGSARDLTEPKRLKETLRRGEERSRSIIERALDAFISIDGEGRITDWNLQAEAIFGWSHAEALGRFLHETIIPQNFRERHLQGIRHLKATGEGPVLNRRIELPALRRDGSEFPVEVAIWPLQIGGESTFHAFISDITLRKKAEGSIQHLNEQMKQRADQLEASNKELEAFSYSVSHDLRGPLRHIHGFIQLLMESPAFAAESDERRHMTVISRAATKMGLLIDALLAFSRTGRARIHPTRINPREMIDDIIQELGPETQGRAVTWQIAPLPSVTADSTLLRLVWTNLLSNALKYTRPRAETKIEIGQGRATNPAGKTEVIFHVRDNGVGFDMAYASQLFGVFQRLHSSEEFEGTGIGLANAQRIVQRHGGRIWAESALGTGTTFYFSLPADPADDPGA